MHTKKFIILILVFKLLSLIFFFFSPSIFNEINYLDVLISRGMNGDIGYYPLVIEYSKLNFNPTFLENIVSDKYVSFPFLPIIFQSLFYKIFGIYSFVIVIFIFQLFLFLILYILFFNIFNHEKKTFYFLSLFLLFLIILDIINLNYDINIFDKIFNSFNSFFGYRYPRPLLTSPIIFLGIYFLINFEKKISTTSNNNYVYILTVLGLLLNLFFYYFIIYTILILLIIIFKIKEIDFKEINFIKIFCYSFLFILVFGTPFVFQQINIEQDNANRIGVINLNFEQRIYLLSYFLSNFKKVSFLALLLITVLFYFFSNKKYKKINIDSLNILFYLIISNLISIFIFILFSPKVVSLYHFIDILIFSIIFYILTNTLIIILFLIDKINFKNNFILKNTPFLTIFFLLILNFYSISSYTKKNLNSLKSFNEVNKFLKSYKLTNTKKKLFTFDLKIMNLWLFLENENLIISEGFSNVNTDKQIEINLINSLKFIGWTYEDFSNFISIGKIDVRNNNLMYLFIYKYQANSLYTFSDSENYINDFKKKIKNISPFRAQNQVIPEDEKSRMLEIFKKLDEKKDLLPDIIILNKLKNFRVSPFIKNKNFKKIFTSTFYDIYERTN